MSDTIQALSAGASSAQQSANSLQSNWLEEAGKVTSGLRGIAEDVRFVLGAGKEMFDVLRGVPGAAKGIGSSAHHGLTQEIEKTRRVVD